MTSTSAQNWAIRTLEVYGSRDIAQEFHVKVSEPVQNANVPWDWDCQYAVEGFADIGPTTVQGPDAIGALQLALNVLGAYLSRLAQTHDIRWFGSRELGFETYRLYQGPDP